MGTRIGGRLVRVAIVSALAWMGTFGSAEAQKEVTAKDRQEAADAYDRGASAYLSGGFQEAAHWFERAYRLAPTSAALMQAIRANDKADNPLRTANLALELREKYPKDARAQTLAAPLIQRARPKFLLIDADCDDPCEIEVDGGVVGHTSFFATPQKSHHVVAEFETGRRSEKVRGNAGTKRDVEFRAPPPPPKPIAAAGETQDTGPTRNRPIPLWAFLTTAGATLVSGGMALWSGLDTKKGVDAYELAARTAASPGIGPDALANAQSLLSAGQKKERRTNALIGVAAGMAAATVVLGVLTDFSGKNSERAKLKPSISVGRNAGGVALGGHF